MIVWVKNSTVVMMMVFATVCVAQKRSETTGLASSSHRDTLNQYCIACHNDTLKTAGLSLQQADLTDVGKDGAIWEKVLRKLQARSMPPVGVPRHLFTVTPQDGLIQVQSEANMQVNFLFFNAYSYQHQARELWQAGCLVSIDAATNNNNKQIEVKGWLHAGNFLVSTSSTPGDTVMPACVKSFAYWDSTFLKEYSLLDSQTGKLVAIKVVPGA